MKPKKCNHLKSQSGMSVLEFVIVAPVLLLCLYAGLEINDRIEAKNALLASVRQVKSTQEKPFEDLSSGAALGSAAKNEFLDWYFKNKLQTSTLASNESSDPLQKNGKMREKMFNNTNGYDLRLENSRLDRADRTWNDLRKERLSSFKSGGTSVLKNDFLDTYSDLTGGLTNLFSTLLDRFKSNSDDVSLASFGNDGFPIFINDKNTTYRHSMELTMPEGSGIWSNSLNALTDMVTRSSTDRSAKSRFSVSASIYAETESGYHPSGYKSQGVIGLVWGFAETKLQSWNEKGTSNRPTFRKPAPDGFSAGCPFNYQTDGGCTLKGNDYSQKVHTIRNVMIVVNTIASIASLGSYAAEQEALNFAVEQAIHQAVVQMKAKIKEEISKQVSGKLDELKEKTLTAAKDQVKKQVDKVTNSVVGGLQSQAENLVKDTFSKGSDSLQKVGSLKAPVSIPVEVH
jgi:hypothetical protein